VENDPRVISVVVMRCFVCNYFCYLESKHFVSWRNTRKFKRWCI